MIARYPLYGVMAVIGLCFAVALAATWRQTVLLVLAIVPVEALYVPAGSLRLKLYQVFALCAAGGMVYEAWRRRRSLLAPLFAPLAVYIGCSTLSLVFTIDHLETTRIIVLQVALFVVFLTVANALDDMERLRRGLLVFIVAGGLVSLLGIYQLFAYRLGLPTGIWPTLGEGRPWKYLTRYGRPSGTFFEPDWYGAFTMQVALIAIPLAVRGLRDHRVLVTCSAAAAFGGMVVSGTRAAWIGFAIGLAGILIIGSGNRLRILRFALVLIALVAVFLFVLAQTYPSYFALILERSGALFDMQSHGVDGRVNTFNVVVDQIRLHPFLGSGTGVLDSLLVGRQQVMAGRLGPNVLLTTWMETGIAGLAILIWLFAAALVRLLTIALHGGELGLVGQAMFGATLAIIVQSQFNNAFLLGFFWVQLAFAAAVIALSRTPEEQ